MLVRSFLLTILVGLWAAAFTDLIPAFIGPLGDNPGPVIQYLCRGFLTVWVGIFGMLVLTSAWVAVLETKMSEVYRRWRHDRWFRGEVRASLADDTPGIPHDQAMSEIDAIIDLAERRRDGSH